MEGRETQKIDPLERIADALEKLASDPEVEIEMGPPLCPSCGKLNPVIKISAQEEQSGPMVELVTPAMCENCGGQLFIVTESYSVHRNLDTAKEEIYARRAGME